MRPILKVLSLIALFLDHRSHGQDACFDVSRWHGGFDYEYAVATSESSVGIATFNLCDSATWNGPRIRTSLFNGVGDHLQDRMFQFGTGNYGLRAAACRSANGDLVAVLGTERMGVAADSIYLLQFDAQGDTIWSQLLQTGTVVFPTGIVQANNGHLLISGYNGQPPRAMFSRSSQDGTLLYSALVLAPSFTPYGIAESPANDLFLCGFGNSQDPYNVDYGVVVKCDLFGNLLWYRLSPNRGIFYGAVATDDGGVIVMGQLSNTAFIEKFDGDGNVLWSQLVASSDDPSGNIGVACFRSGYITGDGDLIACGQFMNINSPYDKGLICKLAPDGTLLGIKRRSHYSLEQDGYFPQRYYNVQPALDGGMMLCGSTYDIEPHDRSHLWLCKLDEWGNLGEKCASTAIEGSRLDANIELQLFPNPTNSICHIQVPGTTRAIGRLSVVVRDGTGRSMRTSAVYGGKYSKDLAIDMSGLSSGTYIIEVLDSECVIGRGKIILAEAP